MTSRMRLLAGVLVATTVCPPLAIAQPFGSIQGRVTQLGEIIVGATLTLSGPLLLAPRTTVSAGDGSFAFHEVPPGRYKVALELDGFLTSTWSVEVQLGQSASLDLSIGPIEETITVAATHREEYPSPHPAWNSWFVPTDSVDKSPVPTLRVGKAYDFYLDLSRVPHEAAGAASADVGDRFLEELRRAYNAGDLTLTVNVRPFVTGGALDLVPGTTYTWSAGAWLPKAGDDRPSFEIRLAALMNQEDTGSRFEDQSWSDRADWERAGGIRFSLRANQRGCSVIVLSILDREGRIPLDALVRSVGVGGAKCGPSAETHELSSGFVDMLRAAPAELDVAGALLLREVETEASRSGRTVAIYIPKEPVNGCATFSWESSTKLSYQLFESAQFKELLSSAHEDRDLYPNVAEFLRGVLFPRARGNQSCDRRAALEALRLLGSSASQKLHFTLVTADNEKLFAPIGLLFALEEEVDGVRKPFFSVAPATLQPLPGLTSASEERCVRNWTFFLPRKLKGVNDVVSDPSSTRQEPDSVRELVLPPELDSDPGTKRDLDDVRQLISRALGDQPSLGDDPIGVILLAHHVNGAIYFGDSRDSILATELQDARFPEGSVALLASCSTGNLRQDLDLVWALSEAGFGTIMLSPFPVDSEFGTELAEQFALQVTEVKSDAPRRVDELFAAALQNATEKLEAGGMALEFVLAGRAGTKVCRTD